MAATTVWGLDIGNSAIKAVKMVRNGDECRIVDFDIVDIPGGEDEKDRPMRLRAALANLATEHEFGADPVFTAVAGNVCLYREFQLPPGSEDKLQELVQFEARQQIPFPLDQVEWGFERYDDPAGIGVALIAVRKTDIQEVLTLTQSFGLNLSGIAASPMALFNFIHYEFKPNSTTLILDSGSRGTDFVVMNKHQLYFRTIQIAGREITRVLESKFKVPYEQAEELKKNIAQSPQMDRILAVIEPTLRQLGAEVQRTIGFYKSKSRGQKIGQCYLLGHTFRLPKMAEYLATQIREAPFALVEGLQRVQLGSEVNAQVWENEFPTMAVAIGLGIQGLGLGEVTLNLIPHEREVAAAVAKWKKWAAAAVIVVLATLGLSYYQAANANDDYLKQSEVIKTALAQVKTQETAEKAAINDLAARERVVRRLARIGHDRGKIAQIYDRLLGLHGSDGRPMFGADTKMYLTNLYISRVPFGTRSVADLPLETRATLDKSEHLSGTQSFYAPLAAGGDPLSPPAELRPDLPLIVILSGEVEIQGSDTREARGKLSKLEDALRRFPEISDPKASDSVRERDVRTLPSEVQLPAEPTLNYTFDGKQVLPAEAANQSDVKKSAHLVFHTIFRWNDLSDRDIDASEVPKEEKKGR